MPSAMAIFGASGDLTSRKLVPALYRLYRKRRLPAGTTIAGFSRTPYSSELWRDRLAQSTAEFIGSDFDPATWNAFAQSLHYQPGDLQKGSDVATLGRLLDELSGGPAGGRVYYLATAPAFYEPAVAALGSAGLADESHGPRRIVIEKPFGTDRESARKLNAAVHQVFSERQVYRIDHYLGKETVQNILVFRFANTIFEPLWNRNYIDHVQITAAEDIEVGQRAGYYEQAGVLRDMFQNHLLQLLSITAMEAPARFDANLVRNEKVKVLEAVRPLDGPQVASDTVRAQYIGYRQEPGVDPGSQTATFAAVKLHVDNWRWQGVPFYLRSGKALDCRTTQIVIQFRQPPHLMFPATSDPDANRLVIHIQPAEGIQLHFQTKVPDAGMQMRLTDLDFRFGTEFAGGLPDAYERLLLDVFAGDASLFARSDEVELAWGIVDPIIAAWQSPFAPELVLYEAGEWGPDQSRAWIQRDGRAWLDVCPVLK
ncbi:MAG: glucose-6-phosphate dehydrogenase [Pirellulales bacterium]